MSETSTGVWAAPAWCRGWAAKWRPDEALRLVSVLAALAAWQASGLFLKPIFISTPLAVARDFVEIGRSGVLPRAFVQSAFEMSLGFTIAASLGITLGLLMGRIALLERTLDPFVNFFNATPTIALLPLMEIWFGIGFWARISFIVVISLWTMLINTLAGVRNVGRRYAEVGAAFGLSPYQATRQIFLPAATPYILAGARLALAQAGVGMILSGQEIGEAGLGGLTETYGSYFQTGLLIAAIVSSTALVMLAFWLLRRTQARFFPWIAATSAGRR
ncbi:MAG TPA: ABC transporter permease [bacterium]|nr:ABC transporter permease [bacterium]